METIGASRRAPTLVLRKTGASFVFEKTVRELLRRVESGSYRPCYSGQEAEERCNHLIGLLDISSCYYPGFRDHDVWQALMEKIIGPLNLSCGIMNSRDAATGRRFPEMVRRPHVQMIKNSFANLQVIEDWLSYHPDILRQIVANL